MAAMAWLLGPQVGRRLPPRCAPRRMPTGAPPAPPPWSHIVACRGASVALWYAWSRARPREAPWRTAAAGHVTGPAPQGRPPWLHAQRACAHFEPSEPLWVQLLQKPRACHCMAMSWRCQRSAPTWCDSSELQKACPPSKSTFKQRRRAYVCPNVSCIGPSSLLESRF